MIKTITKPQIPNTWSILKPIWESQHFIETWQKVEEQYQLQECYPPKDLIFNAFDKCSFEDLKVVIIGQDPYHGKGEAHGLSFSVPDGINIPPSLKNIYREVMQNYDVLMMPNSGDLTHWAEQGVLLLNATLTVQKDNPNSHKNIGWQKITNEIIKFISKEKKHIVFMLWGNFAQKKQSLIYDNNHLILTSRHPSPLSANQGKWFGNQHFVKANQYLIDKGLMPIEWVSG